MSEHFISYDEIQKITTNRKVLIRLSHCPFCGGEAEFRTGGNYNRKLDRRMGVGVRCKDCKAVTPVRESVSGNAHLIAAQIWNKRISE